VIDRALLFLRDQVSDHVARATGNADGAAGEAVTFPDGDKLDPLTLKVGAVNLLLVNMEQEVMLRADDPFSRPLGDGTVAAVQPALRLNLSVLFVARYNAYDSALAALSAVLRFFQANRVFDARGFPDLDTRIGRLAVELITLPLHQHNDLWGALRLAYHPSLLFRVRLLTVEQEVGAPAPPIIAPVAEVRDAVSTAA